MNETLEGEGYYYIVYGHGKNFREVTLSISSLKKVSPKAKVTVISSRPSPGLDELCDRVIVDRDLDFKRTTIGKDKVRGLQGKTMWMKNFIPYERTCFVDGDTYWCESISSIFRHLDHYDVLAAPDPGEIEIKEVDPPHDTLEGIIPPNLGLVLYKATTQINALWDNVYDQQQNLPTDVYFPEYHGQPNSASDQPYFAGHLMKSRLRYYPLPSVYNFQWRKWQTVQGTVKMIHGRGKDYEELKGKINQNSQAYNRIWNPVKQEILLSKGFII